MKIVKLENCAGDDAIVTIDPEFTIKLNKKCELVPQGCIHNKPFKTATGKVKVSKDGLVMKDETIDACKMAQEATSEAKSVLQMFGAPKSCPVDAAVSTLKPNFFAIYKL